MEYVKKIKFFVHFKMHILMELVYLDIYQLQELKN